VPLIRAILDYAACYKFHICMYVCMYVFLHAKFPVIVSTLLGIKNTPNFLIITSTILDRILIEIYIQCPGYITHKER